MRMGREGWCQVVVVWALKMLGKWGGKQEHGILEVGLTDSQQFFWILLNNHSTRIPTILAAPPSSLSQSQTKNLFYSQLSPNKLDLNDKILISTQCHQPIKRCHVLIAFPFLSLPPSLYFKHSQYSNLTKVKTNKYNHFETMYDITIIQNSPTEFTKSTWYLIGMNQKLKVVAKGHNFQLLTNVSQILSRHSSNPFPSDRKSLSFMIWQVGKQRLQMTGPNANQSNSMERKTLTGLETLGYRVDLILGRILQYQK